MMLPNSLIILAGPGKFIMCLCCCDALHMGAPGDLVGNARGRGSNVCLALLTRLCNASVSFSPVQSGTCQCRRGQADVNWPSHHGSPAVYPTYVRVKGESHVICLCIQLSKAQQGEMIVSSRDTGAMFRVVSSQELSGYTFSHGTVLLHKAKHTRELRQLGARLTMLIVAFRSAYTAFSFVFSGCCAAICSCCAATCACCAAYSARSAFSCAFLAGRKQLARILARCLRAKRHRRIHCYSRFPLVDRAAIVNVTGPALAQKQAQCSQACLNNPACDYASPNSDMNNCDLYSGAPTNVHVKLETRSLFTPASSSRISFLVWARVPMHLLRLLEPGSVSLKASMAQSISCLYALDYVERCCMIAELRG